MDNEAFKIYVEKLRRGDTEKISESLPSDFLDIHEEEISFPEPIAIEGEAYVANDSLMLKLNASTMLYMPCSICNAKVGVGIKLQDFYHSEPLEETKSGIFNFKEILREAILLEIPQFAECHDGKCPRRDEIKKYLKKPKSGEDENAPEGYQPFADLDLTIEKKKKTKP